MTENSEPRRRNATKTRTCILEAAYDAFATHGYTNTGIREVADKAEVASSLVLRYFGNKANLFQESLIYGIYKDSLFTRDKATFGRRMAKLILNDSDTKLTAMTILALADPQSLEITRKVATRHVIEPLAEWLGPPNAVARALDIFALMSGFTIQMRVLDRQQISPESVKWLARALQDIVDESNG
jgi:AcrR family transcriptional regulator